jgi:hypothetical protein
MTDARGLFLIWRVFSTRTGIHFARKRSITMRQPEHDPEKHALVLDTWVDTDFPKRSCSIDKIDRDAT